VYIRHIYYKKQEFAWFTISPISTKRTTTSHLNSLNTKKNPQYMKLEIQVLGQAHKCGGVKPVNEIPTGIANYNVKLLHL
jgi:hypothetical protein